MQVPYRAGTRGLEANAKRLIGQGVASWLDPANMRLPSAVVTVGAFEFVLPSLAREP